MRSSQLGPTRIWDDELLSNRCNQLRYRKQGGGGLDLGKNRPAGLLGPGAGDQRPREISGLELRSRIRPAGKPKAGLMAPTHLCPNPQTVLLWSPRGAPAQSAGHDPCQALHPYPCPPRLRKLGTQAGGVGKECE